MLEMIKIGVVVVKIKKGSFNLITPALIILVSFVILVMRRPDIILHAQPWAEDGAVWMAGVYNNGFWSSLILPQNGYYQTISRLTYGFSLLFGLSNAALIANAIAILIRCFFICFILSKRMDFIDVKYRIFICIYFMLMPNVAEGFVNITNAHWYLSMYLFSVVLSRDPSSKMEVVHDFTVLIISALSGPFVVFIAPCLLIKRIYLSNGFKCFFKSIKLFDVIMALCCIIQVTAILTTSESTRPESPLGYNFGLLANIISCRLIFGSLLPYDLARVASSYTYLNIAMLLLALAAMALAFIKCSWRVKILILYPTLMIGFAMARPVISMDNAQWPMMLSTQSGERYFYVTNIAFVCLMVGLLSLIKKYSGLLLGVVTISFLVMASSYYKISPLPIVKYSEDVMKFNESNPGDVVNINILPPGWKMTLIKK